MRQRLRWILERYIFSKLILRNFCSAKIANFVETKISACIMVHCNVDQVCVPETITPNRISSDRIYGSQWNFQTIREGETMENNKKRVIKKYPNRRLYDTEESRYVTLTDIKKLVTERIHFSVTDKKTGEDITRSILLQIITEQEEEGEPLFTVEALEKIIGL